KLSCRCISRILDSEKSQELKSLALITPSWKSMALKLDAEIVLYDTSIPSITVCGAKYSLDTRHSDKCNPAMVSNPTNDMESISHACMRNPFIRPLIKPCLRKKQCSNVTCST